MINAFSVLGMRPISFLDSAALEQWGNESIQQLCDHYGEPKTHTYKENGEDYTSHSGITLYLEK